jgi:hypothetical protein
MDNRKLSESELTRLLFSAKAAAYVILDQPKKSPALFGYRSPKWLIATGNYPRVS